MDFHPHFSCFVTTKKQLFDIVISYTYICYFLVEFLEPYWNLWWRTPAFDLDHSLRRVDSRQWGHDGVPSNIRVLHSLSIRKCTVNNYKYIPNITQSNPNQYSIVNHSPFNCNSGSMPHWHILARVNGSKQSKEDLGAPTGFRSGVSVAYSNSQEQGATKSSIMLTMLWFQISCFLGISAKSRLCV